jgi:hypothetical protein
MSVKKGHMVLYDRMQPALPADNYRIRAATDVTVETDQDGDGVGQIDSVPLASESRYFDIVGPRFLLQPTELAGVYPPRNGHGAFTDTLPHVAFGRRTLPWERDLDPNNVLPDPPAPGEGEAPELSGNRPWMALLLFEEDEVVIQRRQPLEQTLPSAIRTAIEAPPGVVCDSITVRRSVLLDVLPTPDEMEVLAHVRQVNVDDRELAAGDSDGWFSVLMANRLPQPDRNYRACVVSLEGRTDLFEKLRNRPPRPGSQGPVIVAENAVAELEHLVRSFPGRADYAAALEAARAAERRVRRAPDVSGPDAVDAVSPARPNEDGEREDSVGPTGDSAGSGPRTEGNVAYHEGVLTELTAPGRVVAEAVDWTTIAPLDPVETLVLLASWTFECFGDETFQTLTRDLDVGMIGDKAADLPLADTGHVAISLTDRAGSKQAAWYRGPLVPYPMTRDTEGPYHSADQCRRVAPETGAEDLSYSAAFEVGRLLATSDGRLAQELMRWRRTAYRAARRRLARRGLADGFNLADLLDLRLPLVPVLGAHIGERFMEELQRIDRFEMELVAGAPGLDPGQLARVWELADIGTAEQLLAGAHIDEVGGPPELTTGFDDRMDGLRSLRGGLLDSLIRNGG